MSELPFSLNNFKKDELYTFIAGLFTALAWYYHPSFNNFSTSNDQISLPFLILIWIGATMVVYIIYTIVFILVYGMTEKKVKPKTEEALENFKKDNNLTKNSFYSSTTVENNKSATHLYGLIFSSLIVTSYPLLCLIDKNTNTLFLIIASIFFLIAIITTWKGVTTTIKNFYTIHFATTQGLCDTVDYQTYIQERAKHHSDLRKQ